MRKIAFFFTFLVSVHTYAAPSANVRETPAIIPQPVSVKFEEGQPGYLINQGFNIGDLRYQDELRHVFYDVGIMTNEAPQNDVLLIEDKQLPEEGYKLTVTPEKITITASSLKGFEYAFTTLGISTVKDEEGRLCFPSMTVEDYPRFKWRGLMIDSGRHMLPVEDIKKIIGLMSRYKLNTLHWHLTEDQGWRIEIKKYPLLTEIGSVRQQSPVMGNRKQGDGKPYKGYYTQEEIKDIVQFAHLHNITIIPEIEMPGHASAAVAAYPELGNYDIKNYSPKVVESWGVFPYIFNPSEKTFEFIDDVLKEVSELFPKSPYIHIGGDEAPKTQWKESAMAQQVMKDNGLKTEEELQSYFVRRAEKIVNKYGKKLIGWDEINEGGLSPTATMMVWRNVKWANYAIDRGNDVIMVPTSHLYLDYGQGPSPDSPEFDVISKGPTTLEKVYSYDPIPKGLSPEKVKHVIGTQANFWSEYIPNLAKWEYQACPRAIALAEVAWSPVDQKNFDHFNKRLEKHIPYLDLRKINYRKPETGDPAQPDSVSLEKSPEQKPMEEIEE